MLEVDPRRVLLLGGDPYAGGGTVLYWMSRDHRVADNWALLRALALAQERRARLHVAFCLAPRFPGATRRAYDFMFRGLREVEQDLRRRGIGFHLLPGDPVETLSALAARLKAGAVVTDFDPLRVKRAWREAVASRLASPLFERHNPDYDSLKRLPAWARETLDRHAADRRPYRYRRAELEAGETHDPLWNAAQREMVVHGKMHNYLRMYWAKKILEWTGSADEAFEIALALNDRYELDGRDPNGFVGIAWAIGGVHDRAWTERPVFGKIRYMNDRGCRRKFDVDAYIRGSRWKTESTMC